MTDDTHKLHHFRQQLAQVSTPVPHMKINQSILHHYRPIEGLPHLQKVTEILHDQVNNINFAWSLK